MSAAEGKAGGWKKLTSPDKGGRGVRQIMQLADKVVREVWPMLKSLTILIKKKLHIYFCIKLIRKLGIQD